MNVTVVARLLLVVAGLLLMAGCSTTGEPCVCEGGGPQVVTPTPHA